MVLTEQPTGIKQKAVCDRTGERDLVLYYVEQTRSGHRWQLHTGPPQVFVLRLKVMGRVVNHRDREPTFIAEAVLGQTHFPTDAASATRLALTVDIQAALNDRNDGFHYAAVSKSVVHFDDNLPMEIINLEKFIGGTDNDQQ